MSASPTTTPDESGLCSNGCGRPRAEAGVPPFVVTSLYCVECGAEQQHEEEHRERERERMESTAGRIAQLDADLGPRLARYTLASLPPDRRPAREACERWLDGRLHGAATNLYLYGPVGEGKTGLAVAVGREIAKLAEGDRVRFVVTRDWLDDIRRSFAGERIDPDGMTRAADVLILDDLGSERGTPFALDRLLGLIDWRSRMLLPTIVTTNFAPSELISELGKLDETIGQRMVSRLVEDVIKVPFEFGNLRLRKVRAA
jgi:DNA replication protein DnaC